ncbi:MAG: hypothetical protein GWN61_11275 [candidate division Zixibacteria bacterium]|nr:acyl-CoA thioesterase [candidate division Zixibacteria bacterium]NIT71953.1 acyl-CoA thioesterase [candidate division KSB1 bacterium]NIW45603.1 hypothetical protein [Gammaproteobacteria bacterium]NIR64782.1 acyl-CoA thioesterase [candidate division Zixibacteria bacterium]NIS46610.1 acyl-CoA thioesterase [candidate division Zixibacteria bacterium]
MQSKTVKDSRVQLSQLMGPTHANNIGNVHGGWIMKLVDETGALACMRHAQHRVVTVAVDQLMDVQAAYPPWRSGNIDCRS